jgi:hypothetical protein
MSIPKSKILVSVAAAGTEARRATPTAINTTVQGQQNDVLKFIYNGTGRNVGTAIKDLE